MRRVLDSAPLSFGARIARVATDPARVKKLTSVGANTGKFIAGYSLYCDAALEDSDDLKKTPLAQFSLGSKVPVVNGLSFVSRMVALVGAWTKCWSSYEEWTKAWNEKEVAARFDESSKALDLALADVDKDMGELKESIAIAAKEGRIRDSMALVDAYEEASRAYNYLKEKKFLLDKDALAASAALEDANSRLFMAQSWGLVSSGIGGVDALMRFFSSGMKLSLQLAVYGSWIDEQVAEPLRKGLPDALEKISPILSSVLIASSVALSMGDASGMYYAQASAASVLSLFLTEPWIQSFLRH